MKKITLLNLLLISFAGLTASENDFIITVKTDAPDTTDPMSFTIPTFDSVYNYNVDCNNDGVNDATALTGEYTCDYSAMGGAGTYTIRIEDNSGTGVGFPRILTQQSLSNPLKIMSLDQWGTGKWTKMNSAFGWSRNMVVLATDIPNLDSVTNMNGMFLDAELADPDVSNWDVSSVTSMSSMFVDAHLANPDVSNWDVSSVTDMEGMFFIAISADPDVSRWDVSSVTDMRAMFAGAESANPDVSDWDVSSVTDMDSIFTYALSADPDVSRWDVSSVTNMRGVFSNARIAKPDVSDWDVSMATTMELMFYRALSAEPDVKNWDVSSVTDMSLMFEDAHMAKPDVSDWDVSMVTDMDSMFNRAYLAIPDVRNWNVTALLNATNMFNGITLPTINYDILLNNWGNQNLQKGVVFDAGSSRFCNTIARSRMMSTHGWNISDGGPDQCLNEKILLSNDRDINDKFGNSVSLENNRALIGANSDDENGNSAGAAYIFEKINYEWLQTAKLIADDGDEDDSFGVSVSLSGDTALVGSVFEQEITQNESIGAVYVFELDNNNWTQTAKLTAEDGSPDNKFGESVSVSGDRALVAAHGDNGFVGAVYVFDRVDGEWEQSAKLTASDFDANDLFGRSISLLGDRALIGSSNNGAGNDDETGAVYIFDLVNGVWTETVKLVADDGLAGDKFGRSVSIDVDRVLIGAPGFDNPDALCPTPNNFGAAYIFDLENDTWTQTAKVFDTDGCGLDSFGKSVSLSGDQALIGAHGVADNGTSAGAAYVYKFKNGIWSKTEKILASDGATNDRYSRTLSLSNNQILIGAPLKDIKSGTAYHYDLDLIFLNGFE